MEVLMETKKAQRRFTEEFKIEAVKQVTERGHPVAEVSVRLGVSAYSLYTWIKRYSVPAEQRAQHDSRADEIRRLKAELRRVTEERDILKNVRCQVFGAGMHRRERSYGATG
jgi:transposase